MKLNLEQIRAITNGVCRVEELADGFHFYRFSESELAMYDIVEKFKVRPLCTAGVEMEFETDGTELYLAVHTEEGSSRHYFAFEVFVNDEPRGSIKNFEDSTLLRGYAGKARQQGDFEGRFDLGKGMKRVRVTFPWAVIGHVRSMELVGATSLKPIKYEKKLLLYGDSITHGYDALLPSGTYGARVAHALGCEGFNKGIGGEVFRPALGEADSGVKADIVTVAYGTNDWNSQDQDTFRANCRGFLEAVCERQKDAKIFVITPIWRSDEAEPERKFGPFSGVEPIMREVCADLPVTVIRGYDFLPHDTDTFGDNKLHPNLYGFDFYVKSLLGEMRKYL